MNSLEKYNLLALIEIATNKIKIAEGENAADQLMEAIRLLEIASRAMVKSYKEIKNQKDEQDENGIL